MNIANQNAGGTKPAVVGQLSELFPEYLAQETQQASCERWEAWYRKRYPETIETAVGRVRQQIENLKQALPLITDEMLLNWVTDLVISKTFDGLEPRTFSWTIQAANPRLCLYSLGLMFPSDVFILFSLYHTRYSSSMSINSWILTPVQSRL